MMTNLLHLLSQVKEEQPQKKNTFYQQDFEKQDKDDIMTFLESRIIASAEMIKRTNENSVPCLLAIAAFEKYIPLIKFLDHSIHAPESDSDFNLSSRRVLNISEAQSQSQLPTESKEEIEISKY